MNAILYKVKMCADCGELKPITEFHKDSRKRDGRRSKCKVCRVTENSSYYKHRVSKYPGFTKDKLKEMQKEQSYRCLICNRKEYLVIDHDHKNKAIRGLLCSKCNLGLGHFLDSPKRLIKAIIYLITRKKNNLKKVKNSSQNIMNFTNFLLSL